MKKRVVPLIFIAAGALLFVISYFLPEIASVLSFPLRIDLLKPLIQLCSGILFVNAILISIRNTVQQEKLKLLFFPIIVASSSTLLLIGYRLIIGAGIGLNNASDADAIVSGILHNPADNYAYAAWITQAKQGYLTFFNLYTTEPHRPLYFNFLFLTLGTIARWFNAPSLPVLIAAGIVASAVLVVVSFYVSRLAGMPDGAAKWSCVFVAFSSGVSGTLQMFGRLIGITTPPGADLRYQDAILFSAFYSYPYHAISYCLLAILVLFIIKFDNRKLLPGDRFFPLFIIGILSLALNFTHPYEGMILLGGYGVYSVLHFLRFRPDRNQSRLWILALLIVLTVLSAGYYFWLAQHSVWNDVAQMSITIQANRIFWLLGYGLVLPASMLGIVIAFRKSELEKARWMGLLSFAAIILLLVFNIKQTKVSSGVHFFLCLFAGLACYTIQNWFRDIRSLKLRKFSHVLGVLAVPFFFLNSILLLLFFLFPLAYDSELPKAGTLIRSNTRNSNPLVLCDSEAGILLPVLSGVRVYAGHVYMTPGYYFEKRQELGLAGFDPVEKADRIEASFPVFLKVLQSARFEFVLVRKNRPAFIFCKNVKALRLLECFERRCLFATPFTSKSP